jgi:hypothetical protein
MRRRSERSVAPITLNRNSALFVESDGSAEPWAIIASLVEIGRLKCVDPGHWTVTTSPLSIGVHVLSATATEAAGNVSALSSPLDPVIGGATPTSAVNFTAVSENWFQAPVHQHRLVRVVLVCS